MRSVLVGMLTALLMLVGCDVASASPYDIRGEWAIEAVCKACTFPKINRSTVNGTALIRTESAGGEFSGTGLLEGMSGTMSGTVTGTTQVSASVEAKTSEGTIVFTVPDGTIDATNNTITGEGTWKASIDSGEAVINGHRLRTLEQIEQEEEQKEKELKEKREKAEQELREKDLREEKEREEKEEAEAIKHAKEAEEAKAKEAAEKEAQAKQQEKEAQEQKTRAENEARESAEREARARAEREAKEREAQQASDPATLVGKTLALGGSGSLSLQLSNPNGSPVTGEIVLLAAGGHASRTGKGGTTVLGKGSFTLSAHGTGTVKLKLSHSAVAELAHHRTLQATVRVTTSVTGQPALLATYSVTVHGPAHKHR